MHEYEEECRKYCRLAAEHESVKMIELSKVFWLVCENFNAVRKPLNFITQYYLTHRKHQMILFNDSLPIGRRSPEWTCLFSLVAETTENSLEAACVLKGSGRNT
jgi:hypothetical protein